VYEPTISLPFSERAKASAIRRSEPKRATDGRVKLR
jgi:hypothetical protein